MLNIETLKALAYGAGFNLTANTSFNDPATAPQSSLPFESNMKTCYSVCVAALAFDPADRYRPFNARAGADSAAIESNAHYLRDAARSLDRNGLMFIYGLPRDLARYAIALSNELAFRYWIAVRAAAMEKAGGLRPEH